ncbi:r3h domain protein [Niveomyces insectorum RCEF 264]|uniref:R3h domain protein n=1 Tax=Niveomyces insectorum RCEF 264 TaxID=1081102 RepID=A0A167LLS2_9HYPO|nr:r3h domain protein [Niveomyces insectorum RCEF 264]
MTTSRAADILEAKDSQSEFTSPDLPLNDIAVLSLKMPTRTTGATTGSSQALSSSDEVSQRADFGSDVGTKPPSLDGKSITSGTTFNALDEKESLRPDDSASVKAAADEEDLFSNRGSLLISSRLGSDVAAPMQRIQIGDMLPRVVSHLPQETAVSGVATPQSSASEQQAVTEARVQLASGVVSPSGSKNGQTPDDKLLDAMQTPKDRFFLLRLENDVVNFVQNSK